MILIVIQVHSKSEITETAGSGAMGSLRLPSVTTVDHGTTTPRHTLVHELCHLIFNSPEPSLLVRVQSLVCVTHNRVCQTRPCVLT